MAAFRAAELAKRMSGGRGQWVGVMGGGDGGGGGGAGDCGDGESAANTDGAADRAVADAAEPDGALIRITGLVVATIAAQMVLDGLSEWMRAAGRVGGGVISKW
jgi:hypothetical protein